MLSNDRKLAAPGTGSKGRGVVLDKVQGRLAWASYGEISASGIDSHRPPASAARKIRMGCAIGKHWVLQTRERNANFDLQSTGAARFWSPAISLALRSAPSLLYNGGPFFCSF